MGSGQVIDARNVDGLREAMMQTLQQYGIDMPNVPTPGGPTPVAFTSSSPLAPQVSPGATASGGDDDDPVSQLEKLAELKKQGVLTDAEFQAAKTKLLGEI
jgi:hypothetical protein